MKLSNVYLCLMLCLFACGLQENQEATETTVEETEVSEEVDTQEETEEASSEMEEEVAPEYGTSELDFMLGFWKVISYETGYEEIDEELGFYMEASVYLTSYFDFVIDHSYQLVHYGEEGFGDENGIVEAGTWEVSEDKSLLTFNNDVGGVWIVYELTPEKIVLGRKSPAYGNNEITMVLEPMGE